MPKSSHRWAIQNITHTLHLNIGDLISTFVLSHSLGMIGCAVVFSNFIFPIYYNWFISTLIDQVVCGQDHTMFLTESGQVYTCGLSADGQTGWQDQFFEFLPCHNSHLIGRFLRFTCWNSSAFVSDLNLLQYLVHYRSYVCFHCTL